MDKIIEAMLSVLHFNTSNVNIQLSFQRIHSQGQLHFNTSNVNIQSAKRAILVCWLVFQYI